MTGGIVGGVLAGTPQLDKRRLELVRAIAASPERLWEALTDPGLTAQ
jgi:hypothetical protein